MSVCPPMNIFSLFVHFREKTKPTYFCDGTFLSNKGFPLVISYGTQVAQGAPWGQGSLAGVSPSSSVPLAGHLPASVSGAGHAGGVDEREDGGYIFGTRQSQFGEVT